MADSFDFDFTEVTKLSGQLGGVPADSGRYLRKAIEVTARHIDDDWTAPLEGSATVPSGPKSITYDIKGGNAVRGSELSAEIGPVLTGQGPIVGLLEYGTPTTGPRGFGAAALEKNQADFVKGVEIAIDQALKEAGL